MFNKYRTAFLAACMMLANIPADISAQARKPPSGPSGPSKFSTWIAYWGHEKGEERLAKHEKNFEQVCIFAAHFDSANNLVPADAWVASTLERFKPPRPQPGPSYLLTAVNDVDGAAGKSLLKDPACVDAILSSPQEYAKHMNDLLGLSASFDGVEIDYENMWAKNREMFSRFVQELASRLHARGQKLSVVVQPKTSDAIKDGAGAIDWVEISRHADVVKLMAYYYRYGGSPPGPTAPPQWVAEIARFALTQVPREKLCVVLSLEGYDWPADGPGKSVNHGAAVQLARAANAGIKRDPETQAPFFSYADGGIKHDVWFQDAVSVGESIKALQEAGVSHIGLWWLGTGDEKTWEQLEKHGG